MVLLPNYMSGGSEWDGTLRKNNIIYAPNGSGKPPSSILFDSLNGKTKLWGRKRRYLWKENQISI